MGGVAKCRFLGPTQGLDFVMGAQESAFTTSTLGASGAGISKSALRNTNSVPNSVLETEAQRGPVATAKSPSKFVAGLGNRNPNLPSLSGS